MRFTRAFFAKVRSRCPARRPCIIQHPVMVEKRRCTSQVQNGLVPNVESKAGTYGSQAAFSGTLLGKELQKQFVELVSKLLMNVVLAFLRCKMPSRMTNTSRMMKNLVAKRRTKLERARVESKAPTGPSSLSSPSSSSSSSSISSSSPSD